MGPPLGALEFNQFDIYISNVDGGVQKNMYLFIILITQYKELINSTNGKKASRHQKDSEHYTNAGH